MADFVRHEPCPKCGSSDGLARYSDSSAWCFSCEKHHERAGGDLSGFGSDDDTDLSNARDRGSLLDGDCQALTRRGISQETCEFWGYQVGDHRGQKVQIANYRKDGRVVAQKIRTKDKSFKVIGEGKSLPLYGQWLWGSQNRKRIVVTEGEIDALTISQLQSNKWPVVSVPNGAGGAHKTIAREIEYLEGYEEVVFAFDMDEPGQKAAKECAALLSPGKAKIAHLPAKDANAALQEGKSKELLQALWEAKTFRPDGVVGVESLIEKAVKPIERGLDWPWATLTAVTYGRRRREVYGLAGGTGCGKTDAWKEVARHIVTVDELPVGLIFLEEAPDHTVRTIAGKIDGVRYHVPGTIYRPEDLKATVQSLVGKVFLYDHFGAMGWDAIKEKIRYMARALGIKDIFLDHLTALAATIDEDERKALDKIMAELAALAQELDITIYFISHLTTPEGKSHEEGGRVLEKHFRGSRSIVFWSHFIFAIERDKQKPDRPSVFRCLKDRYTGDANGVCFGLAYDRTTGRLSECPLPSDDDDDGPSPFSKHTEEF